MKDKYYLIVKLKWVSLQWVLLSAWYCSQLGYWWFVGCGHVEYLWVRTIYIRRRKKSTQL